MGTPCGHGSVYWCDMDVDTNVDAARLEACATMRDGSVKLVVL
jgi:hypothetical protein